MKILRFFMDELTWRGPRLWQCFLLLSRVWCQPGWWQCHWSGFLPGEDSPSGLSCYQPSGPAAYQKNWIQRWREKMKMSEWLIWVSPWGRLTVRFELLPADWSSCIPEELDTKMEREDEREWLIDLSFTLRKTHCPVWTATRWMVQLHTRRTMYKDRERRWKRVIDWLIWVSPWGRLTVRFELLPAEWSSCIPEELDTKIEREIMEEWLDLILIYFTWPLAKSTTRDPTASNPHRGTGQRAKLDMYLLTGHR